MQPEIRYLLLVILVAAAVTWLTRALPFLVFGRRELPETVRYLGRVLPQAIMVILVVYCLRNTDVAGPSHGIPELAACLTVFGVQVLGKNMYASILTGTVCYMVLLRVL